MKRKMIYGIIALLSLSLFFVGCPTEADDDSPGLVVDQSGGKKPDADAGAAAAAVAAATELANDIPGATVNGTTVILPSGTTTISTGTTAIPANVTLEVPSGADLAVSGTAVIDIPASAALSVPNGASVTIATGTTVNIAGSVNMSGNGTIAVNEGAEVYVDTDGDGHVEATPFIGNSVSTDPVFELDTSAVFTIGAASYTLSGGNVDLNAAFTLDKPMTINEVTLTVAATGELTLDAGITGTDTTNSKIVVTTGGGAIIVSSGDSNFFLNSSSTAEVPDAGSSTLTYTWDDDAGGSGEEGWER